MISKADSKTITFMFGDMVFENLLCIQKKYRLVTWYKRGIADIYQESEVWKILHKYPQYIQDVIYIIDYDTELQMEGLESVLNGPMSEKYDRIHTALLNCGALEEAHILEEARQLNNDSDDYDDYYEQMEILESRTALHNDYDHFWDLVRNYIGKCRNDTVSSTP